MDSTTENVRRIDRVLLPTKDELIAVLERHAAGRRREVPDHPQTTHSAGGLARGRSKFMGLRLKIVHFLRAFRHLGRTANLSRETAEVVSRLEERLGEATNRTGDLCQRLDDLSGRLEGDLCQRLGDLSGRLEDVRGSVTANQTLFNEFRERLAVVEHVARVRFGAGRDFDRDGPLHPLNLQVATPAEVRLIFRTLLGRTPESDQIGLDQGALDFLLQVATSEERRARLAAEFLEAEIAASDYWVAKTDYGPMIVDTKDHVIGESLRLYGHFQEADIQSAIQLLETMEIVVDRSVFLDIGANIGTHSMFALANGFARAVCIEPDRGNFRLLRINQILTGVDARCTNIHAAASDRDGSADLELSPSNSGDHRIRLTEATTASVHGEDLWSTESVTVRRLDHLLSEAEINPHAIGLAWIDTQGHEGHVLSGAGALLASRTPFAVEFWPYGLARADGYSMLRKALGDSGRRLFDLRHSIATNRPQPLTVADLDRLYEQFIAGETDAVTADTDILVI